MCEEYGDHLAGGGGDRAQVSVIEGPRVDHH
jgi:hypothetical protein